MIGRQSYEHGTLVMVHKMNGRQSNGRTGIATERLGDNVLVFEVASILLLVALVGAVIIARER